MEVFSFGNSWVMRNIVIRPENSFQFSHIIPHNSEKEKGEKRKKKEKRQKYSSFLVLEDLESFPEKCLAL